MLSERARLRAQVAQKLKHHVANVLEHFISRQLRPVAPLALLVLLVKDRLVLKLPPLRPGRVGIVNILQSLEEDEVAHLLNGGERVGDAAGPESIPERIDL